MDRLLSDYLTLVKNDSWRFPRFLLNGNQARSGTSRWTVRAVGIATGSNARGGQPWGRNRPGLSNQSGRVPPGRDGRRGRGHGQAEWQRTSRPRGGAGRGMPILWSMPALPPSLEASPRPPEPARRLAACLQRRCVPALFPPAAARWAAGHGTHPPALAAASSPMARARRGAARAACSILAAASIIGAARLASVCLEDVESLVPCRTVVQPP